LGWSRALHFASGKQAWSNLRSMKNARDCAIKKL